MLRREEPKCRTLVGAAVSTGCLKGPLRVSGRDTLQGCCRCLKNLPPSYLFSVASLVLVKPNLLASLGFAVCFTVWLINLGLTHFLC